AESFFATLECELLERCRFKTHAEAKMAIFEFIESFYNLRRRHSALGYLSPADFERRHCGGSLHPRPSEPAAVLAPVRPESLGARGEVGATAVLDRRLRATANTTCGSGRRNALRRGRTKELDQERRQDAVRSCSLNPNRHLSTKPGQAHTCVCQGEKGSCAGRPHTVKTKGGRRIVVRGISQHQLGGALDVRPGMGSVEEYRCLHTFASLNPQFGVYFPLGSRDYPHMELRSPEAHHSRVAMPASTVLTACSKMNASIAHRAQ